MTKGAKKKRTRKRPFDAAVVADDLLRVADGLIWLHVRVEELLREVRAEWRSRLAARAKKLGPTPSGVRKLAAAMDHIGSLDTPRPAEVETLRAAARVLTKRRARRVKR